MDDSGSSSLLDCPHHESLVRVANIGPMKGFLNFDVHLVLDYIAYERDLKKGDNLARLAGLIDEMKGAYRFLCREDRNCIKQSLVTLRNRETVPEMIGYNATLVLNWALIEVAKYCVKVKLSPELSTSEFLNLLQSASKPIEKTDEKVTKKCLIALLFNLEKYLEDLISPSSSHIYTFNQPAEVEDFYTVNTSMFQSWLIKERQDIALLSLIVDDPAECWRIINQRLCNELSMNCRSSQDLDQQNYDASSNCLDSSVLQNCLNLLVLSARQLKSSSLLYGLKSLAKTGEIVYDVSQIEAILCNLECRYEDTYAMLEPNKNRLNDQLLIEYLNSCLKLDLLRPEHQDIMLRLDSNNVYRTLINSFTHGPKSDINLRNWLRTWTPVTSKPSSLICIRENLDLLIPACLNLATCTSECDYPGYLKICQSLVRQDLLAHLLFPPTVPSESFEIFELMTKLVEDTDLHLDDLINQKSTDPRWSHQMYQSLCQTRLLDRVRRSHERSILSVELQAAKFYKLNNNNQRCKDILEISHQHTNYIEQRVKSSLMTLDYIGNDLIKANMLLQLAQDVKQSNYPFELKQNLNAKILQKMLCLTNSDRSYELELINIIRNSNPNKMIDINIAPGNAFDEWRDVLASTEYSKQAKVLLALSARARVDMTPQHINSDHDYRERLKSAFELDLELLYVLVQCKRKFYPEALDCAGRLLQCIISDHNLLDLNLSEYMRDEIFIQATLPVWKYFKANLISIVEYKINIGEAWLKLLTHLITKIIESDPISFLYPVIVNRLDLESERADLEHANQILKTGIEHENDVNLPDKLKNKRDELDKMMDTCRHKLYFWHDMGQTIASSKRSDDNWPTVITKTEDFIREIRRISFLKGEYLKNLTIRIPKRLISFLEYFGKVWESSMGTIMSKQKMEECEKRLDTTCEEALYHVNNLLLHCAHSQSKDGNTTKYDAWFRETFQKQLKELEYRLNLLIGKKPLVLEELDKLVKSIVELMTLVRQSLIRYNHNNRQKLYMELISPKLSRFEPSPVPMPEHYAQSSLSCKTTGEITIHKVYQTVDLISSKTSPKKMTFIGSDGISRSYLLKAHDDLRLDQLTMSIFSIVNDLFKGTKGRYLDYRLRGYAITPVSSRSGLIQWIEAPSLASKYRDWLNSGRGRHVIDEVFASTCEFVCEDLGVSRPNTVDHTNCQLPSTISLGDLFYQLLWARTKPSRNPIAQSRPFFGSSAKYRSEFAPTIFQSVVELLSDKVPNDLLTKSLWYGSNNSYSYWLKTQSFTRSCAVISMVGYILGLGDRHPENILLDMGTGEVIHIDYSICFDLGKTLVIPEQVPFRLTQTIIRAFGFAGLEGEFTLSCVKVLNLLREHKSLLLHLLNPLNLSFMTERDGKTLMNIRGAARANLYRSGSSLPMKSPIGANYTRPANENEMCSQESNKMASISQDLNNLLMLSDTSPSKAVPDSELNLAKPYVDMPTIHSDIQHNIKTPTKISTKTAENMHRRIKEKLSGIGESVRRKHLRKQHRMGGILELVRESDSGSTGEVEYQYIQSDEDLILSDANFTVEEQVSWLIAEATSIKNKAAMFEGWMPWL